MKANIAIKNLEDANAVILNIAVLKLNADKEELAMNEKILSVKKECEPSIQEFRDKIKFYEKQLAEFCKLNKKQFSGSRSVNLTYGRIGMRTGQWALKFISSKFNLLYAKQKFLDLFGAKYVDTTTKLNKTKILADLNKGILSEEKVALAGMKRVKGETTFYEINWDIIKVTDMK